MDLISSLESINNTKKNLIRESASPSVAEKLFPAFPVIRSLSYSYDAIFLANELNVRGLREHGVSNLQKYEFLLHVLDKKKRFGKWAKPEKDELIDKIMLVYECNRTRAKEIQVLLDQDGIRKIEAACVVGGRGK